MQLASAMSGTEQRSALRRAVAIAVAFAMIVAVTPSTSSTPAEAQEPTSGSELLTPTADVSFETYIDDGSGGCGGYDGTYTLLDVSVQCGGGSGPPPGTPNPNGGSHTLQVGGTGWGTPEPGYATRWSSYLNFDLSTVPADAAIVNAVLTVEARKDGDTVGTSVRPVVSSWTETSTDPPAVASGPDTTVDIAPGIDTSIDVTAQVDTWRTSGGHGLALQLAPGATPGMVEFYSREKPAFQATLQVDWEHAPDGPGPDPDAPPVADGEPAPAGTVVYEGGPARPDLKVEIDSAGGIASTQISVRPAEQASYGIAAVAVSPAYDITVPRPESVRSATLTLPYDPDLLDGFAEEDLRLATYLEDAQMWVPVPGGATVDTEANTVTATTDHLSLYAVVQGILDDYWTPEALERLFGKTPVTCIPEGDANATVDVVFMIDTSGSMGWNDPAHRRVDGAQQFVDVMRDADRASVVSFSGSAVTRIGLTELDDPGRINVRNALNATRFASGGTHITSAVQRGISILTANGGGGRLRVGILMTDGEDASDPTTLIPAANDAAIVIHTVGLGSVDARKLQALADGTGGTYQHLTSADQLPDLYDQLARDLIDDGTDSDGDGLTDCEERNGLFSPAMLWMPEKGVTDPLNHWGVFSFTDPHLKDTDGDGTDDGVEAQRVRFADNPALASAFRVMVDAGRDSYFLLTTGRPDRYDTDNDGLKDPVHPQLTENCKGEDFGTSPFAYDSDFDGLSDSVECENGTDPHTPNVGEFGIDGLPPFTLFTPNRYSGDRRPVVPYQYHTTSGDQIRAEKLNSNPLYYDEAYNCVSNCTALAAWAADEDSGTFCWGSFGFCSDDASQMRAKIKEVVEQQGVFDGNGNLRDRHIGQAAAQLCALRFSDSGPCVIDQFVAGAPKGQSAHQLDKARTTSLKATIGSRIARPNPAWIATVVGVSVTAGARVYQNSQATDADRRRRGEIALQHCYQSQVLDVLDYIGMYHPCDVMPIFLPSESDAGGAARNDAAAIGTNPALMVLTYRPAAETEAIAKDWLRANGHPVSHPDRWYRHFHPCSGGYNTTTHHCDEYPFKASSRGGPPPMLGSDGQVINPSGTRLQIVLKSENMHEGTVYNSFRQCPPVANQEPFLVVPVIAGATGPPTDYFCTP